MDEVDKYHADTAERESRGEEPGFESFDEQASLHAYGDDSSEPEVTPQEAITKVAKAHAEAGGLMAAIMLANAEERASLLPTWDEVKRREVEAYQRGVTDGALAERDRIMRNIVGHSEWDV